MTLPSGTWMLVFAAGKDTLMCSLINANYSSTLTAFAYTPAVSVPIQVTLPAGRTPVSAVTVDDAGPHELSFSVSSGKVSFDAGPLRELQDFLRYPLKLFLPHVIRDEMLLVSLVPATSDAGE